MKISVEQDKSRLSGYSKVTFHDERDQVKVTTPEVALDPTDFVWSTRIPFSEAFQELKIIAHLGLPNTVERVTGFLPAFFLVVYMGMLGPDEIAGAGLGFMLGL